MSRSVAGEPLVAAEVEPRAVQTSYPEPFASRVAGRLKRPLGDAFALTNFGVNHTRLAPGAVSALRHVHSRQDEFVYVLEGHPTLITGHGKRELAPGMCVGFKAADGNAHHIVNRTDADVVLLEVGDRTAGDLVEYPDDDIQNIPGPDGQRILAHKDGTPYR
ncbi:MAG TPA: cupin domain-containing protein [Polyangia bacterium]|jgi:uncharacterized cupin superfamily protein|nr:cupin domain-containing protein [Polyangia bacterium]